MSLRKLNKTEIAELIGRLKVDDEWRDKYVENVIVVNSHNGFIRGYADGFTLNKIYNSKQQIDDIWRIEGTVEYVWELKDLWEEHYPPINNLPYGSKTNLESWFRELVEWDGQGFFHKNLDN